MEGIVRLDKHWRKPDVCQFSYAGFVQDPRKSDYFNSKCRVISNSGGVLPVCNYGRQLFSDVKRRLMIFADISIKRISCRYMQPVLWSLSGIHFSCSGKLNMTARALLPWIGRQYKNYTMNTRSTLIPIILYPGSGSPIINRSLVYFCYFRLSKVVWYKSDFLSFDSVCLNMIHWGKCFLIPWGNEHAQQ